MTLGISPAAIVSDLRLCLRLSEDGSPNSRRPSVVVKPCDSPEIGLLLVGEPAMMRFGIYAALAVLVVTLGMIFSNQLPMP